jgi:hypothetical protein
MRNDRDAVTELKSNRSRGIMPDDLSSGIRDPCGLGLDRKWTELPIPISFRECPAKHGLEEAADCRMVFWTTWADGPGLSHTTG